jgi:aromatic-L-amino-acid/L-tryptophan decarboxylase
MKASILKTGAIDDLKGIAEICQKEGLWFHVDGAIGAVAVLSPEVEACVEGVRLNDSLALDLHKWMYMECVPKLFNLPTSRQFC